MTLTPGGGRSPSTGTPPAPPADTGQPRPSRDRRVRPARLRAAGFAIARWGLLMGGLVIIADLATLAMYQRTFSPDDRMAILQADEFLNWILFSVLGVVVVRETRLFYAGILSGLLASVIDTAVVVAAQTMAALAVAQLNPIDVVINSLINVGFAAVSGIVYALVQRSAGGTRPR